MIKLSVVMGGKLYLRKDQFHLLATDLQRYKKTSLEERTSHLFCWGVLCNAICWL